MLIQLSHSHILCPLAVGAPNGAEWIIVLALIFLAMGGTVLRTRGQFFQGPSLVLRKFIVGEAAADGILISIVGRNPGILAWVLNLIGLDADTSITVTEEEVLFKSSSLFGQIHQLVPLPNVSSTDCGFYKPFSALVLGVLFILASAVVGIGGESFAGRNSSQFAIVSFIIGAIALVYYFLSKSIVISLETTGGRRDLGLRFKPSVIEGVPVDIRRVVQAIRLVNQRVVAAQGRGLPVT